MATQAQHRSPPKASEQPWKMKGKKARQKKAKQIVAQVAVATGNNDPVKTILKVKGSANEVGGLGKLKALVDALSE